MYSMLMMANKNNEKGQDDKKPSKLLFKTALNNSNIYILLIVD